MAEEESEEELEEGIEETIIEETSGLGLALIPLVLGILLTIGTIGIKFSGIDPFLGIENPSGVYGEYFLSGVGVGLVILVIGVAMSAMSKKRVEEPFEEEILSEEEEEEEEEGICPTCGAVIPISSDECPECGEELAPPEEEVESEEVESEEVESEEVLECPICGADVSSGAEECPECGEPLVEEEEEEEDLFADIEDM